MGHTIVKSIYIPWALAVVCMLGLLACKGLEDPVFIGVEDLKVESIDFDSIRLFAQATYHNPNVIGGALESCHLEVYANGVHVGSMDQALSAQVAAQDTFYVPIRLTIPLKSVIQNENGLLGGILQTLTQREIYIRYEGEAVVSFAGVPIKSRIERTEKVKLSL